jgi:cytochrome P450
LSDEFDYLRLCFFETMRFEPVVTQSLPSTFYEDVVINGKTISAGEHVIIAIDYVHHHPRQWIEPEKFLPERFDSSSPYFRRPDGGQRHPHAFTPFLGGQRICLGKTFAELMVRFTVSIMLYHYDFKMTDEEQIKNKPQINASGQHEAVIMVRKTPRNPL